MVSTQKSILLVEDDAIIALNQKQQLEHIGYIIFHSFKGEDAVELIEKNKINIDLILMDIDLGKGIDGTSAAKQILKIKELPILFLSSHIEKEMVNKTESITSYGYVVKNSGITIIDASIKMAFKLFAAHKEILKHKNAAEKANIELNLNNRNLKATNKNLRRLDRAIETTKDTIFITDTKGTITYINSQFTKTYGYTKEEVIGKLNPRILTPGGYTDKENKDFWIMVKAKHHFQCQYQNITKFGKLLDIESTIDPIFDETGELVEFVQIHRDITSNKKIEKDYKKLSNSTNTLENILNSFEEAIWSVDRKFNFTFINSYFAGDFKKGLNREIKPGMHAFHNIPPKYQKIWKPKYEEALKGNRISFEFDEDEKRGKKYFRVNLNPIHKNGKITGVSAISVDITSQKLEKLKAIKELKRSQQYLNIAEVMFVAINKEGIITLVNKKMCEISGYTENELLGSNWFTKMIPKRLQAEIIPISKKLLNSEIEPVKYYQNPILTNKGKEVIVDWHNTILKDNSGNITGHLSSGIDVTDKILAENQITKLLAEKDLILKEVHHRIKNNMTTLISLIALQSNSVTNKDTENALMEIENRIRTMMVLYETLFQSKTYDSTSTGIYFSALADNIIQTFPYYKKVNVKKSISNFQIDAKKIFHIGIIINELITNAMKYAFTEKESGILSISISKTENTIDLIVEDNGMGIPESIDINKNPGFGMRLIKMLTEQMEGSIKIENKTGTKITIKVKN